MSGIKHVVCFLTGSVESAVSALLLKRKGYHVTGLLYQNYGKDIDAANARRQEHAVQCSKILDIPLVEINIRKDQWGRYARAVVSEYEKGYTPDSEVLYNQYITFGTMLEYATNQMGANAIATGHYAQTSGGENLGPITDLLGVKLLRAVDLYKDESFKLSQVRNKCLNKAIFPLGDFSAEIVEKIAYAGGLRELVEEQKKRPVMHKNFRITDYLPEEPGRYVNFDTGLVEGNCKDIRDLLIGQMVKIGKTKYYVTEKNKETKDITVVDDPKHPALYVETMFTALAHWLYETPYNFFEKHEMESSFKYFSEQAPIPASLTVGTHNEYCGNDHIILSSTKPLKGVTPGQNCAFYKGEECIGSGKILRSGPTNYAMNYEKYRKDKTDSKSSFRHLINKWTGI